MYVPSEYQREDLTKVLAFDLFAIHRRFWTNLNVMDLPLSRERNQINVNVFCVCMCDTCFKVLTAGGSTKVKWQR